MGSCFLSLGQWANAVACDENEVELMWVLPYGFARIRACHSPVGFCYPGKSLPARGATEPKASTLLALLFDCHRDWFLKALVYGA